MVESTELERVRQFYDLQALENPKHAAVLGEPNGFALAYREYQELAVFRQILPLNASTRLIEFGSGGGRWLRAVAPIVRQCVGVELSERCVDLSRRRLAGFDNVSIHHSAMGDFEMHTEFDVVYYAGILLYLNDVELKSCLDRHLQKLAPDGRVLIRDSLSANEHHEYRHHRGYVATYRTFADWQRIMADQGFVLESRSVANMRPISSRAKHSRLLRLAHGLANRCRVESGFVTMVSHFLGRDPAVVDHAPGYTHEFLLYHRCGVES